MAQSLAVILSADANVLPSSSQPTIFAFVFFQRADFNTDTLYQFGNKYIRNNTLAKRRTPLLISLLRAGCGLACPRTVTLTHTHQEACQEARSQGSKLRLQPLLLLRAQQ